jgi:hypothetical protein
VLIHHAPSYRSKLGPRSRKLQNAIRSQVGESEYHAPDK